MTARQWWSNCDVGAEADSEILAIDRLEDQIAPISKNASKIRELIETLEMCHHKAEKWVSNILEAVATGETSKGLGTRAPGQIHPNEVVSKNACGALSAWVAGCPSTSIDLTIGTVPAPRLLACLGERSPVKEWQVQRVIEKIRSWTDWPKSEKDPSTQYVWLSYDQNHCPDHYSEHEDFWRQTVETMPFEDLQGLNDGEFSLGLAIDLLWTCHWKFVENLQIVLEVIGGNLKPERPFAACAWNIALSPIRPRMEVVCNTLNVFCGEAESDKEIDSDVLSMLGESTQEKEWLAASLAKTIRLQLGL
ncbi:MAG: hypothetical protein JXR49_07815 [Acidobacteria bacterium]|nr:hypothetical protein [Acidobacteriota bacterium]